MRNIAMILAGGSGTRLGADRPKQFVEILGKPVLVYTIEIFQTHAEVDAIEIVCHPDWQEYLAEQIDKYNLSKVQWIVDGGDSFQTSVMNGMHFLKERISLEDIVMIQYGAAPFTSGEIVSDNLRICRQHGMAAACTPCYQLMATNDGDGISKNWVDRDKFIQIACPQSFRFEYLLDIYEQAEKKDLLKKTDPHTTSLMGTLHLPIYQSYSNQTNIKITTKEDLDLFEGYVWKRQQDDPIGASV